MSRALGTIRLTKSLTATVITLGVIYHKGDLRIHLIEKAEYLMWACSRGNNFTVNYILHEHGISPFMSKSESKMTPFLFAIEANSHRVVNLILNKTFSFPSIPKLIDRQKFAVDKFGNNPLHKACRFRNHRMIKMIIGMSNNLIKQRNVFGQLPLEMPHNDILNDERIKKIFAAHLNQYADLITHIKLEKEPDYVFVVAKDRIEVLTSQL